MAVIYEQNGVRISVAFWGRLVTVTDTQSGHWAVARSAMTARCAALLRMGPAIWRNQEEQAFATQYIFERLAITALHPKSVAATMFLTGDMVSIIQAPVLAVRGGISPRE